MMPSPRSEMKGHTRKPKHKLLFIIMLIMILCIQLGALTYTYTCFTAYFPVHCFAKAIDEVERLQRGDTPTKTIVSPTEERSDTQAISSSSSGDGAVAILHVGPHKTGSTTIQQRMAMFTKELAHDGYAVPPEIPGTQEGIKSVANIAIDLQGIPGYMDETSWDTFETYLDSVSLGNQTALISSEEFSKEAVAIHTLEKMLKPRFKKVQVVVAYRRLFEWLFSLYSEIHRFVDRFTENGPQNKGFPSFVEWLRMDITESSSLPATATATAWKHQLQASAVAGRWRNYFDHVTVMNFHEDRYPIEVTFFCIVIRHYLPSRHQTQEACNGIRHQISQAPEGTEMKLNRRKPSEYPRLVYRARQLGLIVNPTITIEYAATRTKEYHEGKKNRTILDFPRDCLEQELVDLLWQASVREEQEMVPEWFNREGGEEHLQVKFDSFVQSSHLCDVDVPGALQDQELVNFLKSL